MSCTSCLQLYSHAKVHLPDLNAKGAYTAMFSLASLKYVDPPELAALLDECKACLPSWALQDLAGLMAAAARSKVRPSNAWLAALMQVGLGQLGSSLGGAFMGVFLGHAA
jgi:hypothetical protein